MASSTVQLNVKNEGQIYTVQVPKDATVQNVKQEIKKQIPDAEESRQKLLFKGSAISTI